MSKLELGDLKNIIKISNRLSEEQIGKVLNELKEDPNFVVDIDKSLSDTLLKFNKLYGDESISKVKFIIDQYGKFNNEKSNGATVGGQPPNGVVIVDSPSKKSTSQRAAETAATIGAVGTAIGQTFRSFWPQSQFPVAGHPSVSPSEITVDTLINNIASKVSTENVTEVFRQILALLTMDPNTTKSMILKKYPDLVQMPMMPMMQGMQGMPGMQGMHVMPVGTVTTAEKVGEFSTKNNIDTMELLSRHGYLAHTPVYPGGSQTVQQTGGSLPDDDFKLELNEEEEGLTKIPVVNLGGAISSFAELPVMDITFDGMIGGGVDTDQPTIYLAGDAEGMVGVPTFMDLFGLQGQADLVGGALIDDSPVPDLVLSGGEDDEDDEDDDDDLEQMQKQIKTESDETPELGEEEARTDEGSLFSDELYTLSDVSMSN
jgi:hypothetical protein